MAQHPLPLLREVAAQLLQGVAAGLEPTGLVLLAGAVRHIGMAAANQTTGATGLTAPVLDAPVLVRTVLTRRNAVTDHVLRRHKPGTALVPVARGNGLPARAQPQAGVVGPLVQPLQVRGLLVPHVIALLAPTGAAA